MKIWEMQCSMRGKSKSNTLAGWNSRTYLSGPFQFCFLHWLQIMCLCQWIVIFVLVVVYKLNIRKCLGRLPSFRHQWQCTKCFTHVVKNNGTQPCKWLIIFNQQNTATAISAHVFASWIKEQSSCHVTQRKLKSMKTKTHDQVFHHENCIC